uniref:Uncharacterized protein n=1 Tax=viral metagenome TaxID=1070528 RepID=A0A6C0F1W3_9ZZZZ
MSGRYNNGNGNNNGNDGGKKFCAVCSSAGRPDYNTHFVRADKFDRSSAITCPYLLSIQCRICGGNGHTASYCKFQSQSQQQSRPQRLPPISQHPSQQQQHRAPPRIVFETSKTENPHNPQKTDKKEFERAFPPLGGSSSRRVTLPPLSLSYVSKVRNDEPLLRRGPPEAAQASPVHSPAPKRKRSNNPFAVLEPSSSDSDSDYYSPVAAAAASPPESSPEGVGRCRQKSGASWASSQPVAPRLAPLLAPVAAPLAPLAPLFKSSAKPNWGDTDSEDDEEFLKGF